MPLVPRTFWNLVQQSSAAMCHHSIGQPPPARYLVHLPQSIIRGDAIATWHAVIRQPPVTCQSTWTVNGRSTVVNDKSTIVQRWSTAVNCLQTTGQPPPDHRSMVVDLRSTVVGNQSGRVNVRVGSPRRPLRECHMILINDKRFKRIMTGSNKKGPRGE
ncbi:hypothetical protein Tco_0751239 [Tanacetum coccineum]|uniref:Secreted protein n=1 Tax=Tanacetum coccineum TaxID=301880 RepID=A0ABQ4Z744_9ASTR